MSCDKTILSSLVHLRNFSPDHQKTRLWVHRHRNGFLEARISVNHVLSYNFSFIPRFRVTNLAMNFFKYVSIETIHLLD